jgi:hypothetical protein
LVTGLNLGANTVAADGKSLVITNYSIKGPILSGPYVQPFICQTATFRLPDGTFLGAPTDADCSAPTKITYMYMPQGGTALVALPSTSSLPANVSMTTTLDGTFGTLRRACRDRHDGPRHLPERRAARSDIRGPTDPVHSAQRLEPSAAALSMAPVALAAGTIQGASMGVNILTGDSLQRLVEGWGLFINTAATPVQ